MNRDTNQRTTLTPAQAGMLARVQEHPRVFNARARRTIQALEGAGLVRADWHMDLAVKGTGTAPRWRITVIAAADRRTMYVHRTRAGREGWTRVPASRALAEMDAWRSAGWHTAILAASPDVRARVRAWEHTAHRRPAETAAAR